MTVLRISFLKKGFNVILMKLPFYHIFMDKSLNFCKNTNPNLYCDLPAQMYLSRCIYNCKTKLVYEIVLRYTLLMHFILRLQGFAMH